MARTPQNDLDMKKFLHQPEDHDLIILCFEESKDRAGFLDILTKYMLDKNFKLMTSTYMYEIFIVSYIVKSKLKLISGSITTSTKACGGIGALKFGNKGGV